jgi:phosphopantothenate-cysteine ligase
LGEGPDRVTPASPIKVVVAGGGTIAPIDDVRYLANISSGRFAAAITEACLELGARVWHIHARTAQIPVWRHASCDLNASNPAEELFRLASLREKWLRQAGRLTLIGLEIGNVHDYATTLAQVLTTQPIDIVILPMAVADFEPEARPGKISSTAPSLDIHCLPTPKVINSVRDWAPSAYLVGFKLLSGADPGKLIGRAEDVLSEARADLVVGNDLTTLKGGRHTLHLVRQGHDPETLEPGVDLAERLVARIFAWARRAGAQ